MGAGIGFADPLPCPALARFFLIASFIIRSGAGLWVDVCRNGMLCGFHALPVGSGVHGAPGGAEEVDAEDYGKDERQNRHGDVQG